MSAWSRVVLGTPAFLTGGPPGWHWVHGRVFRLVHLALIAITALQAWMGRLCPLTIREQAPRNRAGQTTYDTSFIQHWLSRLIFFDAPWWLFVLAYTAFAGPVAFAGGNGQCAIGAMPDNHAS